MKIINKKWFPIIEEFSGLAKDVDQIVMFQEENTEVAGSFEPEKKIITLNIEPAILMDIADRFGLKETDLELIALAVFFEECMHSQGIDDEERAASLATIMINKFNNISFEKYVPFNTRHNIELIKKGGILTAYRHEEAGYNGILDEKTTASLIQYVNNSMVKTA